MRTHYSTLLLLQGSKCVWTHCDMYGDASLQFRYHSVAGGILKGFCLGCGNVLEKEWKHSCPLKHCTPPRGIHQGAGWTPLAVAHCNLCMNIIHTETCQTVKSSKPFSANSTGFWRHLKHQITWPCSQQLMVIRGATNSLFYFIFARCHQLGGADSLPAANRWDPSAGRGMSVCQKGKDK